MVLYISASLKPEGLAGLVKFISLLRVDLT